MPLLTSLSRHWKRNNKRTNKGPVRSEFRPGFLVFRFSLLSNGENVPMPENSIRLRSEAAKTEACR